MAAVATKSIHSAIIPASEKDAPRLLKETDSKQQENSENFSQILRENANVISACSIQKYHQLADSTSVVQPSPYSYVPARANPILHSLSTLSPIFHELQVHPKLIRLISEYISFSFQRASCPSNVECHCDSLWKAPIPQHVCHIPLLGRQSLDSHSPQLCHPFYVPANAADFKQVQQLMITLEYLFCLLSKQVAIFETDIIYFLCILDRFFEEAPVHGLEIKMENATMIVVVCLMIVNKVSCDYHFKNSFWSNIFSIPLNALNHSERIVLETLDYELTFQWVGKRFFKTNISPCGGAAERFDPEDPFDKYLVFLSYYASLWRL